MEGSSLKMLDPSQEQELLFKLSNLKMKVIEKLKFFEAQTTRARMSATFKKNIRKDMVTIANV
jgi:hypothetical protein